MQAVFQEKDLLAKRWGARLASSGQILFCKVYGALQGVAPSGEVAPSPAYGKI